MKKTIAANFNNITGDQIKFLAKGARCDESYVRKILAGRRRNRSRVAEAIFEAAKKLNQSIETGKTRASKELIIIGEND